MAWACGECGSGFTLRLSACPRCGSTEPMGRTAIVPKVTAHGGPSSRHAEPGEVGWTEPDQPDDDGGDGVSPGMSSPTSSGTPDSSTTSGLPSGPKRARTTGNRSSQDRAGRSTAGGTGSSGRGTG